jgi:NhaA family Na+:H+ antiporter
VFGAGILGGIGFTMSIFVSNLAFVDAHLQVEAKFAILITSLLAGFVGYMFLRWTTKDSLPIADDT